MFELIAHLVTRRGWLLLLGWIGVAALLTLVAPSWDEVSRDDDVRFFPAKALSVLGQDLLERGFPDATDAAAVVIVERPEQLLSEADLAFVERLASALRELVGPQKESAAGLEEDWQIRKVTDFREPVIGNRLLSEPDKNQPGQAALTIVAIDATYMSKQARLSVNRIEDVLEAVAAEVPEGLNIALTGSAVVGHDMNEASNKSIDTTTYATIVLVLAILLMVYRSPLLALIPLLTIALSVFMALKGLPTLIWVPGLEFQVINVTRVFVIVVLFGAGTDYCLFLIARYREELGRGRDRVEAVREAIHKVGAALVASAGTVIVGLGMLWFSTFAKIRYSGPAIALSLAVALAAALTLAPVLLIWMRGAVFWPFKPPQRRPLGNRGTSTNGSNGVVDDLAWESPVSKGLWDKVADLVVRRPGIILTLSMLALIPFAVVGVGAKANFGQLADLPRDAPSVIGSRLIGHYFTIGELGPTTVLIEQPDIAFSTDEGREAVAELSRRLLDLEGMADVRSLTRPLGAEPLPTAEPRPEEAALPTFVRRGLEQARQIQADRIQQGVEQFYISSSEAASGQITRLDLVFATDPFSEEGLQTLEAVRALVAETTEAGGFLEGASAGFTGATPQIYDLKAVIAVDKQRMYILVTIGVYLILVALLRRPGISLYLIATVVLGYLSTLGLTELVFRAFHEGPEPWGGLDWKVSFFLFVILVAVGEDYNIFLMSRVIEEEREHGPVEGTRRAVARTGGIISSCGIIMAGTFASMLTGRLVALRELGFALSVGVLLDTFVVRPILVPAFIILLNRFFPGKKAQSTVEKAAATSTTEDVLPAAGSIRSID